MTILAAYAPGPGHCNTLLPLVEDLAAQSDCRVYLCGSQEVAAFTGIGSLDAQHQPAGFESYLRSSSSISGDEIIRRMGQRSRRDIERLITELHPDLIVCDTSERGAVVAAVDHGVPFLRVVSCADAATPNGSAEEARRRTLVRGYDADDLRSPLNLGTVAFGPRWFFSGSEPPQENLRCYRYRSRTAAEAIHGYSRRQRPRALISFGTFITEPPIEVLGKALMGLIDAGIKSLRVKIRKTSKRVILRGWSEYLSARTGVNISVTAELDLLHHLPHADLLLCHGSATSTLEALHRAVVPIIAPAHNDTLFVARRCIDADAGVVIDPTGNCIRKQVHAAATAALHSPQITAGMQSFAAANSALPPIAVLVDQLVRH
ncbi:hypothetical protein C5E45_15185 [Nocardia nova]|uniref:Glycosyl transferase family 28 C-terminal domain-containing protein n=2 Tax=Nocardia nova TaxID=37330 RepID=A0A2S6AQI3_9NOCA|nr:hypothetical protein C5E41_26075 [Nocardia nova]PPJ37459.1 hypothetical protein C5E45_15185 [Nocardia nova]